MGGAKDARGRATSVKLGIALLSGRPMRRPALGAPAPGSPAARQRDRLMGRPPPKTRYGILFMPRSSSSRLTAIASAAGLGRPGEFLSPRNLPAMAAALGSSDLSEHVELLLRFRASDGGVFGLEASPIHVLSYFGRLGALSEAFGIERWAWLVRRDIVSQAVSTVRKERTRVGHDTGDGPAPSLPPTRYAPSQIRRAILRLVFEERLGEAMIRRLPAPPVRLDYEGLTAMPEEEVARAMAGWIGVPSAPAAPDAAYHRKLPPGETADHAARFRAENGGFLRGVERIRARTLGGLPARQFATE